MVKLSRKVTKRLSCFDLYEVLPFAATKKLIKIQKELIFLMKNMWEFNKKKKSKFKKPPFYAKRK